MADPEEARAALQALFGAARPRSPQSAAPEKSADGESASQRAGVALRQLFKGDIHRALHSSAAAGRLKEIEGRCTKLLEQVSPAGGGKFKPPPRTRPSRPKTGVDMETQTIAVVPPVNIDEIAVPERPEIVPDPDEGKPRHRCCIIQDKSETGEALRRQVAEAQRRLHALDSETTKLTREVKMNRIAVWEHQRSSCAKEVELRSVLAAKTDGSKDGGLAEEVAKMQDTLCEARQKAKFWSRKARHQDADLQQQFRPGGEAQKILRRHPAGEVFLPPMGSGADSDDGSDDEYYRPSPPAGRRRGGGEVQLASSDEDEEPGGGGRPLGRGEEGAPPPPPSQQWRQVSGEDDDAYASDATSMTSPSSKSGGGPSPTAGEAASQNRLAGNPLAPRARSAGSDSSRSSSDADEADPTKQWRPPASQPAPSAGSPAAAVPPLPELSGLAAAKAAAKAGADADVAEEVSSEEIYSQDAEEETSRSV